MNNLGEEKYQRQEAKQAKFEIERSIGGQGTASLSVKVGQRITLSPLPFGKNQ